MSYALIMACDVGGASMQITDYAVKDEATVEEGRGLTGRKIMVAGSGYVEGANAAAFATNLGSVRDALRVSGRNLVITGLNGEKELELTAASCLDGGPHASFEQVAGQDGQALRRNFRFTISATQGATGGPFPPPYKVKQTTYSRDVRPDGLARVSVELEIKGALATQSIVSEIDRLETAFPWPKWVTGYRRGGNEAEDSLTLSFSAQELASPLPTLAGFAEVVWDGEQTTREDRDEQGGKTTTASYDLLISGDPRKVRTALRPAPAADAAMIGESMDFTSLRENRVRLSFTTLETLDGSGILEFDADASIDQEPGLAKAYAFAGASPILVVDDRPALRVGINGRAVGLMKFPKAPSAGDFAPPGYVDAAVPTIHLRRISPFRFETTWQYAFVGTSPLNAAATQAIRTAVKKAPTEFYP